MTSESLERASSDHAAGRRGYAALLTEAGSWFGAWGIQMVIFQWLVVVELQAAPSRVGAAQMSVMLPSLVFLLVGGATADRLEPRRLLVGLHLAAATAVASLCLAVVFDALTYALLIVFALVIGTLQAFAIPARDTQLSEVLTGPISRAVAGATMTQHFSQVVGAFVAGGASWLGGAPLIGLQGLLLLSGVVPALRLPVRSRRVSVRTPLSLGSVGAGFVEVMQSPLLRPVMLLALAVGVFFVGPFLVVLPLLVRDFYGGGALEMGILTGMFPLGSVLAGLVILWRGGITRNGRALVLGQISGASCIGVIALGPPFVGAAFAVLGWGMSGAYFINAGRTLFQTHASEANRARVLSVYTLGVMGGGPVGSLLSGFLVEPLGLHAALAIDSAMALAIVGSVVVTTRVVHAR